MIEIYVFYPDVFFVNNLIFDFSVISLSVNLSQIYKKKMSLQLFIYVAIEAIISTLIIVFINQYILYVIWKILCTLPILGYLGCGKRRYLLRKMLLNFYIVAIMYAGTIIVIQNIFGITKQWILLLIASYYLVNAGVAVVMRDKKDCYVYECDLCNEGHMCKLLALWDSGNRLYSSSMKKPVHILSEEIGQQLDIRNEVCQMKFSTLGREGGKLQVYKVDKLQVYLRDNKYVEENALVGLANKTLMKGKKYKMILNGDIK